MWNLLMGAALVAGAMAASAPAEAYPEGPWCLKANIGNGAVTERCYFGSFESCNAERGGWGSSAFCVQNARFLPYWQGRGIEPEPRRARFKKHRRR